jgi:hypothetical protein
MVMASKAPMLVPKGAFLMGVLVEGKSPKPDSPDFVATKTELDIWIKGLVQSNTWTLDETDGARLEVFFKTMVDNWVLIDLKTMKILGILDGVDAALAALDAKL